MTMYLVLSALTSSPISLVAANKASADSTTGSQKYLFVIKYIYLFFHKLSV